MADETLKGSSSTQTVKAAEAATMEEFQATPYYQGLGIEALQQQLSGYTTDDATLRQQAETQYKPTYDTELESLRQQLAQQVQGYNSQISSLGTTYDQQRRRTNEAYDQSAVQLDNALTKRGLGRSSLVSTQGAYLEKQRNQSLGDIDATQTSAVNALNEKIALLTDQTAQSERRLANSYAAQIESRINELRRENQSAATNLQLQIASLQQQGYQAYQNWLLANREMELAEKQFEYTKSRGSGSSSSSGNNSNEADDETTVPPSSDPLLDKLIGGSNSVNNISSNSGKTVTNTVKKGGTADAPMSSAAKFNSLLKNNAVR